jgi:hypothetical protein
MPHTFHSETLTHWYVPTWLAQDPIMRVSEKKWDRYDHHLHLSKSATVMKGLKLPDHMVVPARAARVKADNKAQVRATIVKQEFEERKVSSKAIYVLLNPPLDEYRLSFAPWPPCEVRPQDKRRERENRKAKELVYI